MNIPTPEEMVSILNQKLEELFPDESVEMGENWERIAEIFYIVGFNSGEENGKR